MKSNNYIKSIKTKKDFLSRMKRNPELLSNLSEDRLDVLIKIYEESINEKMKIIYGKR